MERLIDEFLAIMKERQKVFKDWEKQQERLGTLAKFLITDDGELEIDCERETVVLSLEDTEQLHRFLREWFDPDSSAKKEGDEPWQELKQR